MRITGLRDSSFNDLNSRSSSFIAACGFEERSSSLAARIAPSVDNRIALCFTEITEAFSRKKNQTIFRDAGFSFQDVSGNDSLTVSQLTLKWVLSTKPHRALAIDVSSMTRAWHGAIIRTLSSANIDRDIEVFFTYVTRLNFRRHQSIILLMNSSHQSKASHPLVCPTCRSPRL